MGELENMRPLPRISVHAFCESEALAAGDGALRQDRRMAKVSLRITSGGDRGCRQHVFQRPDAQPDHPRDQGECGKPAHAELAPLAAVCDPSTKVIVIGRYNDIPLYRELIRNGISEYMVQPVAMPDIMMAIAAIFVDPDAEPLGRSIAFIGAKGGVGSSTIAHNCAFGISNLFSTETILADLDLPYGTANIDFDQDPAQGIAEAVFAPERLDEVFLDRLLTKCSEHLSLLAAPSLLDRAYDFDGQAFQPVLEVLQRSAPVAVLDVPHAWSEWTRSVLAIGGRGRDLRRSRSRQPAQRQEHVRCAAEASAERQDAASRPQPGRHAEAAGNCAVRFLRAAGDRADRDHSLRHRALRQCRQ